jgi:hypothetical protein
VRSEFAAWAKDQIGQSQDCLILLGDISVGLFCDKENNLPEYVENVGILEQSLISFAAGVARGGSLVVVHTISPFLIERAYEQIKLELGYNLGRVLLVSANGPFDYQALGPTHHCPADVPLLSLIPNLDIYLPASKEAVHCVLDEAKANQRSAYVRLSKFAASQNFVDKLATVNNHLDYKRGHLNIFVGEAVWFLEHNLISTDPGVNLFIQHVNPSASLKLDGYETIDIWEPYSRPVIETGGNGVSAKQKIRRFCYPRAIASGIYSVPFFLETNV